MSNIQWKTLHQEVCIFGGKIELKIPNC